MNAMTPLARIRAYAKRSGTGLYVVGWVWPTKTTMVAYLRSEGVPGARDTAAICRSFDIIKVQHGRTRKLGHFADVHFYKACMGGGLVAHEFMHATFAYARRVGIQGDQVLGSCDDRDASPEEERLCDVHGRMVASFVNRCYKIGIYDPKKTATRGTG